MFKLQASYKPTGDQPKAIKQITKGFTEEKLKKITLLGATGTGKTFTMANIIQNLQKPTLILSHNKTLAAQLATEFKYFFPKNAVHYFVSYFDYYQPEAYIPEKDMYIEKDSAINKEIEMYRLATMASLLTREDVIVVSSVSALYGLGSKETFENAMITLQVGQTYNHKELKKQLIALQYKPMHGKIEPGTFDFKGDIVDIYSTIENNIYRLIFDEDELVMIQIKDATTWENIGNKQKIIIRPATQFLQEMNNLDNILNAIKNELEETVKELKKQGKNLEAERLYKRTMYDLRMIKETGYVNGIENYSMYFEGRLPGQPPNTLFDYFPDDFLLIIDESHMSIPQLRAMPQGDKSRKLSLIQHGFRLPSAAEHRPLNFEELEYKLGWKKENQISNNIKKEFIQIKKECKTLFVSATPGEYELNISEKIVEQIIRPTGLLDPITYVYPKSGDYNLLLQSLEKLINKKPYLKNYLKGYDQEIDPKKLFFE